MTERETRLPDRPLIEDAMMLMAQRDALYADNERLREALLVAAEDLEKAANQCESLHRALREQCAEPPVPSQSARRFAEKAKRARKAAQPKDADNA